MKAWEGTFRMPIKGRSAKPRSSGYTMVLDKGLGLRATEDLMELASDWIDNIKLTFGTSAFYSGEILKKKNEIIKNGGCDVMPGGTFLEVAVWQGVLDSYLKRARELGFTMIEVSDGTIEMTLEKRKEVIKKSLNMGFKVISEVGKKDPNEKVAASVMHEEIKSDLESGVFKVIVEAREAGKGVGIYDEEGKVKDDEIETIISGVEDLNSLIWEAPIKNQQQYLIMRFGPNVNLGNVPPADILALEALRQGLRGDTLKKTYLASKE